MEKHLHKSINKQIESNQGKNLFSRDYLSRFRFIEETIHEIGKLKNLDEDEENLLIKYASEKAIEEILRINQYFSFNEEARTRLNDIYRQLLNDLKEDEVLAKNIADKHYKRLRDWLTETNPFAKEVYERKEPHLKPLACAEYSPELQMDVLHIEPDTLIEPLLDLGCGKQALLVNYLRNKGVEAFGTDRLPFQESWLCDIDWLDYDFGIERWGTIVSHMAFSNHFNHHHLRNDGHYIEYAKKYMQILKSLKPGGSFYYTPDLPFIEQFLDPSLYKVEKYKVDIFDFYAVRIIKRVGEALEPTVLRTTPHFPCYCA